MFRARHIAVPEAEYTVLYQEELPEIDVARPFMALFLLKKAWRGMGYLILGLLVALMLQSMLGASKSFGAQNFEGDNSSIAWRIRFLEAATVAGPNVTLGEIAAPVGNMPSEVWSELSARSLWPSPTEEGRPANMTRPRLQQAAKEYLGEGLARLCLYPPSLALQRGGVVLTTPAVQEVVVKTLTPLFGVLPGEGSLQDFRLPSYVFLKHAKQTLELEKPDKLIPGRLSLRFNVHEVDGSIVKRLTGTVFLDCWANVPCAATPINKGDVLEADHVTFVRKNLASLREAVWDGKGGPWRLARPVTLEQVIYQSDLSNIPTVAKGSKINLLYEGQAVRLTALVEAMADGVPGETIPVRNLESKKQVYATVRDGTTVFIRQMQLQASQNRN